MRCDKKVKKSFRFGNFVCGILSSEKKAFEALAKDE